MKIRLQGTKREKECDYCRVLAAVMVDMIKRKLESSPRFAKVKLAWDRRNCQEKVNG